MSRSDSEHLRDIGAAIERCRRYRDKLDSIEFGQMAYDAVLRNILEDPLGELAAAIDDATND